VIYYHKLSGITVVAMDYFGDRIKSAVYSPGATSIP